MTIDSKIVALVYKRAQGYCEKCGRVLGSDGALHHRKLKSRGGKDSVANLMYVHHACHNLGTDSIHLNPSYASDKGWMVASWAEPEATPIFRPDGNVVRLHEDGSMTKWKEQDEYSNNS